MAGTEVLWKVCEHGCAWGCHDMGCANGTPHTVRRVVQHAEAGHHFCAYYGCETVWVEELES